MSFRESVKNSFNRLTMASVDMPPCANFGMRCIKILLILVNMMFLVLGILLISVGTTIHALYNDVQELLGADLFSPALMLTVLGVLVLMVTAFGCLGTFKNSTCMINTFGAMLLLLFVLEVAAAVSSFAVSGTVSAVIVKSLRRTFHDYEKGDHEREKVDLLQEQLNCCGINNFEDWKSILNNASASLPSSCCSYYDTNDRSYRNDYYHTENPREPRTEPPPPRCVPYSWGCARALHYLINTCAIVLSAGTIAVCVIQILGVTFAFQLAKSIRQAKTAQDMERCAILRQESEPLPQTQADQEQIESRDNEYKIPQ